MHLSPHAVTSAVVRSIAVVLLLTHCLLMLSLYVFLLFGQCFVMQYLGLKILLQEGISEPVLHVSIVYKLKKKMKAFFLLSSSIIKKRDIALILLESLYVWLFTQSHQANHGL